MEISILITLDLREQAALQAALVTHAAPDCLMTLALAGGCRITSFTEAYQLRLWLTDVREKSESNYSIFKEIEEALKRFGI
jgi:hypothetical protein